MPFHFSDLQGKTLLITGTTRGIGKALLPGLIAQGLNLILRNRDHDAMRAIRQRMDVDESHMRLYQCDLADRDSVTAAANHTASVSKHVRFDRKIEHLPDTTHHVLANTGYDNMSFGDRIEYDAHGRRTGKRFLCPPNPPSTGIHTADDAEAQLPADASPA